MKNSSVIRKFQIMDRQKASFTLSIAIIASVFLIAITGILTGRFRPFASQVNQDQARTVPFASTVFPPVTLSYTDSTGVKRSIQSNSLSLLLGGIPVGDLPLQGIARTQDTEVNLVTSGKVMLRDADGKPLVQSPVDFSTKTFATDKNRFIRFDQPGLFEALDNLPGSYNVKFIIKPQNYLAVSQTTANIDANIVFPEALVGDVDENQDNEINEKDFAIWSSHFGKPVTAENTDYDFNKDGRIDEVDFAISYSANFGKKGESL